MTTTMWLRIAAGLTLFQAVGHTFGGVLAGPASPGEAAMRESMRAFRVTLMGIERNYMDFYYGSGWTISVFALALAAVMWLLVPVARQAPTPARPIVLALAAAYAGVTVVSALYFVTAPIVVGAAITLSLTAAALSLRAEKGR